MSTDIYVPGDRRPAWPLPPPSSVYLAALRRGWIVVVLAIGLAVGSALAVTELLLSPVYRSSSTLLIKNQPASLAPEVTLPAEPFIDDQSLSETFEQLALQPDVVAAVASRMGLRPSEVQDRVQVHALPRTPLVVISFDGPTPGSAARGAQAYTADFVQRTQRNDVLPGRALVVSAATVPVEPVAPRPALNALVAGVAAGFLTLLVLLARAHGRASGVPPADRAGALEGAVSAPGDRGPASVNHYLVPRSSSIVFGYQIVP